MTAFLDTNILISLLDPKEPLHGWSIQALEECKSNGLALVSDVVYCEFSVGMSDLNAASSALISLGLERYRQSSDSALFKAGRAFKLYRERGGTKTNVLPDFIIGALADDAGLPLITNNPNDFGSYFPHVQLVTP